MGGTWSPVISHRAASRISSRWISARPTSRPRFSTPTVAASPRAACRWSTPSTRRRPPGSRTSNWTSRTIWQATVRLIRETCAAGSIEPGEVDRIAIASQAQTFALLDADGQPLTPFVSWLDTRGAPYAGEIAVSLGRDFHSHCSFSSGMAEMALTKVLWMRHDVPDTLAGAAHLTLLPSYILSRLAGLAVTDANLAAMSGLYSLQQGTWWREALDPCGLSAAQLPGIAPMGTPLQARHGFALSSPLREDLEIVLAGNDQTAGAFGNGCGEGDWVVTLGTALVAYRYAGSAAGPLQPSRVLGPLPRRRLLRAGRAQPRLPGAGLGTRPPDARRRCRGLQSRSRQQAAATGRPPTCADAGCFYPARMATPGAWIGPTGPSRRALAVLEGIGFSLRRLIFEDLEVTPSPRPHHGHRRREPQQLLAPTAGRHPRLPRPPRHRRRPHRRCGVGDGRRPPLRPAPPRRSSSARSAHLSSDGRRG